MRHRVGSITKTFTAAAVLQQVERGQIELDTPIGYYLPGLVPGERGDTITVRMLINHISGLAEYLPVAYPSLRAFPSLAATTPGKCITQNVIERAGLRDTELPAGPHVNGPHSQIYEAWFGMIEPPRDYSVYDMSWVGPAASLISTVADLNRFYAMLLAGEIVNWSSLAQMQRTVPVISFEGKEIDYGLGLHKIEVPGHGTFWGDDGTVWGAGAISMTRADGKRQMSVAVNLMRWNKLDSSGRLQPHPVDDALQALYKLAMCGTD